MPTLNELIAQREELDRQIEAARKEQGVNPARMFVPESGEGELFYSVLSHTTGYYADGCYSFDDDKHAPKFRTEAHAEAIAFARSIEDQMRAQPGCVVAEDGVDQFIIEFTIGRDGNHTPFVGSRKRIFSKLDTCQFGVFDTEKNAEAAIATVGAENLTRAAKAKVGIY